MFGKKKHVQERSAEDRKVDEILHSLLIDDRLLEQYCYDIIKHEGCANMLPEGADKEKELARANERREFVKTRLAIYEEDLCAYNMIDQSKLVSYTGLSPWPDSHEELARAWKRGMKKVYA